MKRTQVQLDDETYTLARARVFERGISIAALLREALHVHLGMRQCGASGGRTSISLGPGGLNDAPVDPISENHDAALAEDTRW